MIHYCAVVSDGGARWYWAYFTNITEAQSVAKILSLHNKVQLFEGLFIDGDFEQRRCVGVYIEGKADYATR